MGGTGGHVPTDVAIHGHPFALLQPDTDGRHRLGLVALEGETGALFIGSTRSRRLVKG